jgi:acetyl-CoA synthetase
MSPSWKPSEKDLTESNLARFMADRRIASYADLHAWSVERREEFWAAAIERLGIVFTRRPETVLAPGSDPADPDWLPGAQMNIVDSCFRCDPARTAVVTGREGEDGVTTTTYGGLERLVDRFAHGLVDRGFRKGNRIALYMPMTVECVAAYLGTIRAGCQVVSIADSFSPEELKRRLAIAEADGIVVTSAYTRAGKWVDLYEKVLRAEAPRAVVLPDGEGVLPDLREDDLPWEEFLGVDEPFVPEPATPSFLTNILFSSGTTDTPKAIPWTHLTPVKCAMDGHFHQDIRPSDVVAWPTNIGWMMGPWLIYASLINGAAVALFEGAPTGRGFVSFVREAGVTILGLVPSLVRAWRNRSEAHDVDWSSVRLFSSTGEPSNADDYAWLMERPGKPTPVIEYCGGTEIGGGYITGTVVQPASPSTFTTPALGLDLVILDDHDEPADDGEVFLVPPSIGLSQDLLNRDHHEIYYEGCPSGPDGAILRRHGDRMTKLPGGYYKAGGRADDTMNLDGIKVGSLELEQLLETHPSVSECAAVSIQPMDDAEKLVVFAVTPERTDLGGLEKELGELLASRMNPLFRIHDLIRIQELPRTASNKLMRRSLRSRYLERR